MQWALGRFGQGWVWGGDKAEGKGHQGTGGFGACRGGTEAVGAGGGVVTIAMWRGWEYFRVHIFGGACWLQRLQPPSTAHPRHCARHPGGCSPPSP